MEAKLDEILTEFRKGHREASVISVQTVDSLTTADKEVWRSIRKELEDMGLSLAAFDANKDFIFSWLVKAMADGAFEEQAEDMDEVGSGSDSGFSGSASTTRPASPGQVTSGQLPVDANLSSSLVHNVWSARAEESSPYPPRFPISSSMKSSDPLLPKHNVERINESGEDDPQNSSVRTSETGPGTNSATFTLVDDEMEPSSSSSMTHLEVTKRPSTTQKAHLPSQTIKSHLNKLLTRLNLKNLGQDLISATEQGDTTKALKLLRSQDSPQIWVKDQGLIFRALISAVQKGLVELLEPLLVAGQIDINDCDLLTVAVESSTPGSGGIDTLQQLLNLGADPSLFGSSCVLRAIDCKAEYALRALLDAGIDVNAGMGSEQDLLPLHQAIFVHASDTMVQMLLDNGAEVNRTGLTGQTPLGLAILTQQWDVVHYLDLLIRYGADLEQPAPFVSGIAPVTPLIGAIARDELSIAKFLVRKGADINEHLLSLCALDVFYRFCEKQVEYPRLIGLLGRAPACAVHVAVVLDAFGTGTLSMLLEEGAQTNWDTALLLAFLNYKHRHVGQGKMLENSQGALVAMLTKCSETRGKPQYFRFLDSQVFPVMAGCVTSTKEGRVSDDDSYLRSLVDEVITSCS